MTKSLGFSNRTVMVQRIIVFAALVAVSQAVVIGAPAIAPFGHYGPAIAKVGYPAYPAVAKIAAPLAIAKVAEPYDPNPQYSYSYDIHDALTGDTKNQQESRQGDVVQGSYSLVDPDGFRRTVEYTADPVNGFNAVVHREPLAVKAVAPVAKIVTPYAHAPLLAHGPVVAKVASPYAPIAKVASPYGYPGAYPAAYPGAYPGGYPAVYHG